MSGDQDGEQLVAEVSEKARELSRLLDGFGDRLRRMRSRNKQLQDEIEDFDQDLDRIRGWLDEQP